jgi:hydroxymethylpyrimidine pyrophosphatase-like HAD family hydrolase
MPVRREAYDPDRQRYTGRVGRILHHDPLAPAVVREALEWCRTNGLDPHMNDKERFIVWDRDPQFEDYSAFLGPAASIVSDLEAAAARPMSKVISSGEPPLPMQLYPIAKAHFAGRADATLSHPRFLEFVAPGVSKGKAVAWLAHRAGIPLAQVMTVGDAYNDLEMIADAGHGTAMASAPPDVRLAARYIAPPVDEDGSAQLIEQLILAAPADAAANMRRLTEEAAGIQAHLRELAPSA